MTFRCLLFLVRCKSLYELRHDKTNKVTVYPAKTQISLGIRPVWSESSLSAWRKLEPLATHWAHSEDSDQTGWMPRLIWVFTGRTVTLLVLSCRGTIMDIGDIWFLNVKSNFRSNPIHSFTEKNRNFLFLFVIHNCIIQYIQNSSITAIARETWLFFHSWFASFCWCSVFLNLTLMLIAGVNCKLTNVLHMYMFSKHSCPVVHLKFLFLIERINIKIKSVDACMFFQLDMASERGKPGCFSVCKFRPFRQVISD